MHTLSSRLYFAHVSYSDIRKYAIFKRGRKALSEKNFRISFLRTEPHAERKLAVVEVDKRNER